MNKEYFERPLQEATLNSLIEGFQLISYEWKYLYVNEAVVKQSKVKSKNELLGYTMMEKFPGIEKTELFIAMEKSMKERVRLNIENEFKFPDGSKGWFELRIQPVPEGIFILSADITERKRAEEDIRFHMVKLEEMMHMTSHRVRQPVAHIIGMSNLLETTIRTQEELKKIGVYMKQSALALDDFTKELTIFMEAHKMDVQKR